MSGTSTQKFLRSLRNRFTTDLSHSEVFRLGAEFGTQIDGVDGRRVYWIGAHIGHNYLVLNFW